MGVMVTSTYGDLCPCSRQVGMALQNLSAQEVQIPPKTAIGNVQMAEVVPDQKGSEPTGPILSQKEQAEQSKVSQSTGSESPEKELTCQTPISHHWG